MKKFRTLLLALTIAFTISSCYTLEHTVGTGAKGNSATTQRAWYILWGIVPLNKVDSKAMAGGASNYQITSQVSFIDGVINIFTSIVTVYCQSVMVTK
jgi:hypothetical protein